MQGRTHLYRIVNNTLTLTVIRYWNEILRSIVRPFTGLVGPGFLLVNDNTQPHVARCSWRKNELIPLSGLSTHQTLTLCSLIIFTVIK